MNEIILIIAALVATVAGIALTWLNIARNGKERNSYSKINAVMSAVVVVLVVMILVNTDLISFPILIVTALMINTVLAIVYKKKNKNT